MVLAQLPADLQRLVVGWLFPVALVRLKRCCTAARALVTYDDIALALQQELGPNVAGFLLLKLPQLQDQETLRQLQLGSSPLCVAWKNRVRPAAVHRQGVALQLLWGVLHNNACHMLLVLRAHPWMWDARYIVFPHGSNQAVHFCMATVDEQARLQLEAPVGLVYCGTVGDESNGGPALFIDRTPASHALIGRRLMHPTNAADRARASFLYTWSPQVTAISFKQFVLYLKILSRHYRHPMTGEQINYTTVYDRAVEHRLLPPVSSWPTGLEDRERLYDFVRSQA